MPQSVFSYDPIFAQLEKKVVATFGSIELGNGIPHTQYFDRLVESIVSQQLSVKVADVIYGRLTVLAGDIRPEAILAIDHDSLRSVGLSNAKAKYVRNLAEAWNKDISDPVIWHTLTNEDIVTELTKVKGIGRWTAEMFLMFSLSRPDVFSVGDLGLRNAVRRAYNLAEDVKPVEIAKIAENWAPHRTLAARILWKSLELPSEK